MCIGVDPLRGQIDSWLLVKDVGWWIVGAWEHVTPIKASLARNQYCVYRVCWKGAQANILTLYVDKLIVGGWLWTWAGGPGHELATGSLPSTFLISTLYVQHQPTPRKLGSAKKCNANKRYIERIKMLHFKQKKSTFLICTPPGVHSSHYPFMVRKQGKVHEQTKDASSNAIYFFKV